MTTIDQAFTITHTKGDTLNLTLGVLNEDNTAFAWATEGYSSAVCSIKTAATDAVALLSVTVSLATAGALVLSTAAPVALAVGSYVYDIQFTRADGSKETWWSNRPSTFTVTQDVS